LDVGDSNASHVFLEKTRLGQKDRPRGLRAHVYNSLTTSAHAWMWDSLSLARALEEHGFQAIRRCSFGDCEDSMFAFVEDARRFENAAGMEARA